MNVQNIKLRFGIIGNSYKLNQGINIASQVAATDLSVLITGESGTGKEIFPQIIHQLSSRKHGNYIAVNCGAIPDGTIDSELFGHEKGSFTGAHDSRKGYFEVANNGTIFLDEVAELPLSTQVRLLRVLETGEFLKVGSSKSLKTNVRVIAATNVDLLAAIANGKFREDLYYRLNTVPIVMPPLRSRGEDILLLFKKFAADFSDKYKMPPIKLNEDAIEMLLKYRWPGNVRQLKNVTEQISIIAEERDINAEILKEYLPNYDIAKLPAIFNNEFLDNKTFATEREILYKILFDMKNEITELKKTVNIIMNAQETNIKYSKSQENLIENLYSSENEYLKKDFKIEPVKLLENEEILDDGLSLTNNEKELIKKSLSKYDGKRKLAAQELGISERTLYRKIKEYGLE